MVTVYTAGDDGRYSVPYRAMVCSSGGSGTPLGDFSLDGWYRWEWLGLVGGVSGQYCTQIYGDHRRAAQRLSAFNDGGAAVYLDGGAHFDQFHIELLQLFIKTISHISQTSR